MLSSAPPSAEHATDPRVDAHASCWLPDLIRIVGDEQTGATTLLDEAAGDPMVG